jgi:hypothetical protein
LPLLRPGIDVAPWIRCSMSSAPNALMAVEFVHLMQDSTAVRRDGQHRFEVRSKLPPDSSGKDERMSEAMIDG